MAFAHAHPALFRLMFGPALARAARDAYGVLAETLRGDPARGSGEFAAWALVHGLATLLIDGALPSAGEPAALVARVRRGVRLGDV